MKALGSQYIVPDHALVLGWRYLRNRKDMEFSAEQHGLERVSCFIMHRFLSAQNLTQNLESFSALL
jgi:hypothetical protein